MAKYIVGRLIQAVPLLFIISLILFTMMNTIGDPIATMSDESVILTPEERLRIERSLGLDKPIYLQYIYWLIGNDWTLVDSDGDGDTDENVYGNRRGILRGDLGRSIVTNQLAQDRILERLPNTLILMVPTYILVLVISVSLGVFSAVRQYSLADNVLTTIAFVFYSMPSFLIALGLIFTFAVTFRNLGLPYLPIAGMYDAGEDQTFVNLVRHMILPIMSMVIVSAAGYMRYIRASMLETLESDYVRTARAKGLKNRRIILLHAFKNASVPLITLIGLDLGFILSGTVIIEEIFAWPGMGRLFIDSLNRSDYAVLMGIVMLTAVTVIFFQIVTDLAYAVVDPRIKLAKS